jgi:8-amino-7-oxononanoate synthase
MPERPMPERPMPERPVPEAGVVAPDEEHPWRRWARDGIVAIRDANRWRTTRAFDGDGVVGRLPDGREVVSFASNDYLGLASHPAVRAAAVAAIERWGTGAGASRLIVGSRPVHDDLEEALAGWKVTEAALLFPTGFAANTGLLAVLGEPGVRIASDALNHASIIDGCRMAATRGAEVRVYPHADLDALDAALDGAERAVVVTDGVFSMDGDVAPWSALGELCARHRALLVVDEAHVVLDPLPAPPDVPLVRVGTLSKTLGSLGGFVAADREIVDLLVNRARPFIFTTAPTPADAAAALAALDVVQGPEGRSRTGRLRRHVEALRPGHPSPIVPVIVGTEAAALAAAEVLLGHGLLVPAIRPPTVPEGTCRLRIALSAAHSEDQIATLRTALAELAPEHPRS